MDVPEGGDIPKTGTTGDGQQGDPGTGPVQRAAIVADSSTEAADKLCALLGEDASAIFFFASAHYDLAELGLALEAAYPGAKVFGCTTSGEIGPDGYGKGTVTAFSLPAAHFAVAHEVITPLSELDIQEGRAVVQRLHAAIQNIGVARHPEQTFGVMMVDGMSLREESVLTAVNSELGMIQLFGGSAADDLHFENTAIFHDGRSNSDAALLVFVNTDCPFHVFCTQHFEATDRKMVITEADAHGRLVSEINAAPAATEYARLIGVEPDQLDPQTFAAHPVMVRVGGDYYVRSIQRADADEKLRFFCAIDEGLVLTIARAGDIVDNLRQTFSNLRQRVGDLQLVIGCDCVFRKLEIDQTEGTEPLVANLMKENRVVGFSTYGEQFGGMHVNQTFTGVGIGWPENLTSGEGPGKIKARNRP
ncbi:MAG: nitric oxide-sensing protein NosP [Magnetovibrionaceae bacterium]